MTDSKRKKIHRYKIETFSNLENSMKIDSNGDYCKFEAVVENERILLEYNRTLYMENQELKEEIKNLIKELEDECDDLSGFGL